MDATILEITQDALRIDQTHHFNVFLLNIHKFKLPKRSKTNIIPYHLVSCLRFDQVMCDWLNHAPKYGIWDNIVLFLNTIQMPICYVRLFDNHKYMDIYISLYVRNTAILENKKSVCIFPHQLVNTSDLHLFWFLKCAICGTIPAEMTPIGQLLQILKVY